MVVKDVLFSKGLAPQIDWLNNEARFGVCEGSLQITQVLSGCAVQDIEPCGDRFTLLIPYAGHTLNWEVIFSHEHPQIPPDFIFNGKNEEFCPELEDIKSLVNWNPSEPHALSSVLKELLHHYKQYQLSLVNSNSRLKFEYSSLLDDSLENGFQESDIEVYVQRASEHRFGFVNFLLKLPVNFSNIPSYYTKDCVGQDTAVLLVSFQSAESGQCVPKLFLSARVKQALGSAEQLRIPSFPSQGCLLDYVPSVIEVLENKVKQIVKTHDVKKQYVSALKQFFGSCLLEYNREKFNKISFLMEWHDFFFIVTIDIPAQFPSVQPSFIFQSVYHVKGDDKPYWKCYENCPHNKSATAIDMALKAKNYILDTISDFQKSSVSEGLLQNQEQNLSN